ncbi:MAG: hypothetical protein HYX92_02050 [Chloroflexi bacterium]|nr:hypothetical protein [Chloroflexota bacterium]
MAEFTEQEIPAVVLAAPTWERPARALARALKVAEAQVVTLPLGDLFPDSADAARRMRETAHEVVPLIVAALKKSDPVPAR